MSVLLFFAIAIARESAIVSRVLPLRNSGFAGSNLNLLRRSLDAGNVRQ